MTEYILLIPNNIKKNIIKEVREKYYNYNIKFMSLEDFTKRLTFTYDQRAVYYLMKRYNFKYSTALVYLNNLCYISDKLNNDKMNKLKEIKAYLDEEKLLIYDKYFKNFIQNKKIIIYGYDYINKYNQRALANLDYEIIEKKDISYPVDKVYIADSISNEVIFVCDKIMELLKNNIDIKRIKVIISNEYEEVLKRNFKFYNIPFEDNRSIYSLPVVKKILNNLNEYEDLIDKVADPNLKSQIINIFNNYNFIQDKEEVRELLINDFKSTSLSKNKYHNIIKINDYIDENDYVFLLGYNKENIPYILKDDDYFSDREKEILGLDTSNSLNIINKTNLINRLHSVKHLIITSKRYDFSKNYSMSDLLDNITYEEIINDNYSNANMINKVLLTEKLDNLIKYNIKDKDTELLYSNYQDIPYMEYDNKYHLVTKNNLYAYLDNKLLLSYTSFENYNKCSFKYYLSNILKLNIIKNDFSIIIGNICHYVLSKMDNLNFDFDKTYNEYINGERVLTKKEKFFLNNIKEELKFIINTIKKQMSYTSFDKKLYEEKVYVNKDKNIKVTFMGIIDKVLYKEEDNITYLAIVDYKTGNINIKLNNMKYGLGMQLPIYLYLSKNMKLNNIQVVGFYLQKLLTSNLDNTKNYDEAKEATLKLEGYSVNNESILSKFDNTYNDSKLIKSMKTSSKGFYAYSKVLSNEEINDLVEDTDKMIDKTIDNILDAKFDINPKIINGENVSCTFCEYKDICFMKEKDKIYIDESDGEANEL